MNLQSGVASHGGKTASVVLVAGHPDVPIFTPAVAPGVLDDPVVAVVLAAEANGEDTVVEVVLGVAAIGVVVDT